MKVHEEQKRKEYAWMHEPTRSALIIKEPVV